MTRYRSTELAISVFLVILGAATVIGARYTIVELKVLQDAVGARGFAYVVGAMVFIGGLTLAAMQLRKLGRLAGSELDADDTMLGGDDPRYPSSASRVSAVFGALVLYAILLKPAGYILATTFFIGGGTWIMGGRGSVRLIWFPLSYAIGTFLLFDTVLGARIPDGILHPLMRAIGL
jgi:putative tricarboxylic transport membrane protein